MATQAENLYVTQTGMPINPRQAYLNIIGVDTIFPTISVTAYQPLQDALEEGFVSSSTKMMLLEIGEKIISIPMKDLAFHHVAQGEIDNIPWIAVFCACCNMGSAMSPVINGKTHHFSATGLYNSMAIIRDAETGSFWEHAAGECIQGAMRGSFLETIPSQFLLVEQILEETPEAFIIKQKQPWWKRLMGTKLLDKLLSAEGFIPAPFRLSMGKQDDRLPEMQLGLGAWVNGKARFYSMKTIEEHDGVLIDTLNGQNLVIFIDPIAQIPIAYKSDAQSYSWDGNILVLNTGERIFNGFIQIPNSEKVRINVSSQQFMRWFAFSYKFPNCNIFTKDSDY